MNENLNQEDINLEMNEISEEELALIELEENYQRLVRLFNSIECMVISNQMIDLYQKLVSELQEMDGYKDTEVMIKKCKDDINRIKEELKRTIYQKGKYKKEKAKNVDNYMEAIYEFEKIKDYLDSKELIVECQKLSDKVSKAKSRKGVVKSVVAILIIVMLFIAGNTTSAKYYYANICMATKAYPSAIKMYTKLQNYKDSEMRVTEGYYLMGKQLSNSEDLAEAINSFKKAGNYKNSEELKLLLEKKEVANCKVGETITFGDCKWRVLETDGNQALLIRNENLTTMPYNFTKGNVTWESSSIREWLNTDYLNYTFNKEEQKAISVSSLKNDDNPEYGTKGGNDTKDSVFLLSIDEAKIYLPMLPTISVSAWLRSPGNNLGTAAFYSANGAIMNYGYATTSRNFQIRPLVKVSFQ